jgi:hypothetical protein
MIEEAFDAFARSVASHVACEISPCPVYLAPDRFVTIKLHAAVSGYSEAAIRSKIKEGVWIEGREYVRAPDGHVFIDREGVQRWLVSGS